LTGPGSSSAVDALLSGGVVLLDTDTLPGLHALATVEGAASRIAEMKGHRQERPYLLLVDSVSAALDLGDPADPVLRERLSRLWPGELTALLRPRPATPLGWTDGGRTIGLRVPAAAPLRALLASLPGPLFSTSANRPGEEPATTLAEARVSFPDAPVLDLGIQPRQGASTIVDFTVNPPNLVRAGIIPFES
jgi:L-threonylcarbamoyladenylate synthase